jgi:hypothetical protein
MSGVELVTLAMPLVWLGLVVGLSFIEAPLKFRAPGITIPLGLGIGRLVFRALGRIELVAIVLLTALVAWGIESTAATWWVVGGLWLVVLSQQVVIRPRLARRTDEVLAGRESTGPSSHAHVWFVAVDVVKVALLIGAAVVIGNAVAP